MYEAAQVQRKGEQQGQKATVARINTQDDYHLITLSKLTA